MQKSIVIVDRKMRWVPHGCRSARQLASSLIIPPSDKYLIPAILFTARITKCCFVLKI